MEQFTEIEWYAFKYWDGEIDACEIPQHLKMEVAEYIRQNPDKFGGAYRPM